jgi:hypothetical protein
MSKDLRDQISLSMGRSVVNIGNNCMMEDMGNLLYDLCLGKLCSLVASFGFLRFKAEPGV